MSFSSLSPGGRFASILPRDDSIFLRVDRIADNSEEADAICLFRRLIDETIEYKITKTKTAKSTPPYAGSNRDADRLVIASYIQDISMPGFSIVFPCIRRMELSMPSPFSTSIPSLKGFGKRSVYEGADGFTGGTGRCQASLDPVISRNPFPRKFILSPGILTTFFAVDSDSAQPKEHWNAFW